MCMRHTSTAHSALVMGYVSDIVNSSCGEYEQRLCRVRYKCLSTLVEVAADPKLRSIMLRRRLYISATIFFSQPNLYYIYYTKFHFSFRVTLSRYACLTHTRYARPGVCPPLSSSISSSIRFSYCTLLLRLHHLQNANECVCVCAAFRLR